MKHWLRLLFLWEGGSRLTAWPSLLATAPETYARRGKPMINPFLIILFSFIFFYKTWFLCTHHKFFLSDQKFDNRPLFKPSALFDFPLFFNNPKTYIISKFQTIQSLHLWGKILKKVYLYIYILILQKNPLIYWRTLVWVRMLCFP